MRNLHQKLFAFLLLVGLIISCGTQRSPGGSGTGAGSGAGTGSGGTGSGGGSVAHFAHINHGGGNIAYLTSFSGEVLSLYVPSVDRYVQVYRDTGTYYVLNSAYFSNAGCTGTVATLGIPGETGKSVIYALGTYYIASSQVLDASVTPFAYQSYASGGTCTNNTNTLNFSGWRYWNLTATTQPYDFASKAPLSITWE